MSALVFRRTTWLWWSSFGTWDISLGLHLCWRGRLDLHIGTGMLSVGRVPLYSKGSHGKEFAVSNSFHTDMRQRNTSSRPVRAGVP